MELPQSGQSGFCIAGASLLIFQGMLSTALASREHNDQIHNEYDQQYHSEHGSQSRGSKKLNLCLLQDSIII